MVFTKILKIISQKPPESIEKSYAAFYSFSRFILDHSGYIEPADFNDANAIYTLKYRRKNTINSLDIIAELRVVRQYFYRANGLCLSGKRGFSRAKGRYQHKSRCLEYLNGKREKVCVGKGHARIGARNMKKE